MAHSPAAYDRGTRFTNYSSIHSADAFVGDYQMIYTPGTSPAQPARTNRKSTRFSRPSASIKNATVSQSYVLPANLPNTSQLVPDNLGPLPNVQVRYTIPADEKQIVASLRTLQGELSDAQKMITTLTRERDAAMHELKSLKTNSRKSSTPKKPRQHSHVEEDLFDLTRLEMEEAAKRSPIRPVQTKKVSIARGRDSPTPTQNERNVSHIADAINQSKTRRSDISSQRPYIEDPEQSIAEDHTAASNTSRRRRHQLDDNMTSAYILPDITVAQTATAHNQKSRMSREAQRVIHNQDPAHLQSCSVCRRLVGPTSTTASNSHHPPQQHNTTAQNLDFTAQITQLLAATNLDDPTIRPKISPHLALANVRTQLNSQYEHAKQKHGDAWEAYDSVPAPLKSKRHEAIGNELKYWAGKMEEFRVLLDNLRDVEEGVVEIGE